MKDFFTYDNLIKLFAPMLPAVLTVLVSYFVKNKSNAFRVLDEQYIHFVAPIYYLLINPHSDIQLINSIDKICSDNPHLIPDGFIKSFTFFRLSFRKYTSIENTDFFIKIDSLYKFLRYNLHYSKRKPTKNEIKSAQKQLGKQPSFWGSFSILLRTCFFIVCLTLPAIGLYQFGHISDTLFSILLAAISFGMAIWEIRALNRYYAVKI